MRTDHILCAFPRCRNLTTTFYYGYPLCDEHLKRPTAELHEVFKIKSGDCVCGWHAKPDK